MFTTYKRGKIFWLRQTEFGREYRRSLKTRDRQVAARLLLQIQLDVLSSGRVKRIDWPAFQKEFLEFAASHVRPNTLRGYRITADHFGKFLERYPGITLADITPAAISAYTEKRKGDQHPDWKRPKRQGGILFDLRCLHRLFNYAVDCKYIELNPVRARRLNSPGGRTLPFTQDEINAMLADKLAGPQLQAIILTFLYTGLRISDVLDLKKREIHSGQIVRRTTKRGTVVSTHVHPKLAAALKIHLGKQEGKARASEWLFTNESGLPLTSLDKLLRRLWKRCGVAGGHAHRFRDTHAVRLLSKGASLYDVAKLMGISHQTAALYYTPFVKELQERAAGMVQKLDFS